MGVYLHLNVDRGRRPSFFSALLASEWDFIKEALQDSDCKFAELVELASDEEDRTFLHPGDLLEELEMAIKIFEERDPKRFECDKEELLDELGGLRSCIKTIARKRIQTLVSFSYG